jgi:hypothetical protein
MKNLKEIRVNAPHVSSLSPEMINIIKDGIISYIKEEVRFSENYNFIDNYFDNSDVQDLFKSFIFDQMVFSHYSIARNGKEVLVSHNTNIDNITEEEIREYIDSNATLKKYLKDLLYKFYFEHVDISCLTKDSIQNAMRLKKKFEEDGENFDKWDATSVVHNVIGSEDCPSIFFSDVLYDNDLYSFLQQEFNNSNIMQEIKVNTPYSFGDNPKTLNGVAKVETDFFGKGYTLALVDLGSHYTFIPYGDQPFVILIPKQYIEPTDKEYYPISSDGVQQLKDLLRQGKIEKVKAVTSGADINEIKTQLSENETAYHGSSNYFTSFKKEGIGGGSGAQAYGWGLYFGKDPNIAKSYTMAGPNSKKTKNLFQGKTAEELGFEYENEIFFGLPAGFTTAQEYIEYAQEMILILEEEPDFEGRNDIINQYKQFIEIIQGLEIEQEPMQYLYKVTLFPNKTPDYLNWDNLIPQEQLDKINQQLQQDNLNLQIKPNIRGNGVYDQINAYFKDPKKASMFLLKAGIDGVTHANESVRIVFDDSQIKIDKIYKTKEFNDVKESKKRQLNEYAQKIIDQLIAKWQKEMRNTLSNDDIKVKINRFDQIKQNIPVKIKAGTIVVPDKFTKPNPDTNKIANPTDILNYTWKELETVLDAYGEKAAKTSDKFYTVQDADFVEVKGVPVVYSGNGVKVYEGSNYDSCVKLNYVFKYKGEDDKIYTYSFCIGRKEDASNQYYSYRFGRGGDFRSFYFVADTTQSADIKGNPTDRANFLNWYHFFVIHAFDDGKFGVTDVVNQYGSNHEKIGITWEEVGQFMIKNGGESGQKAWDKIKNQKDIFKYVPPSDEETEQALVRDQILNAEQFAKLTRNQKRIYVSRRADQPNAFNSEMFKTLDVELKNLAIRTNNGFVPTFNDVKNNPSIGRSYARFKFTRIIDDARNGKQIATLIPLPFVQFLNEDEKQQYLELFSKDNLTFEYIEKYFGENAARKYVEEQSNALQFLPPDAVKYIQNPKIKQLYQLYAKLIEPWKYDPNTNISDEDLEKMKTMPTQMIDADPIDLNQWKQLSDSEKKAVIGLAEKLEGNPEYADFLYALPIIVRNNNETYLLLPKKTGSSNFHEMWMLVDERGNIIKDNIPSGSLLKGKQLYQWSPDDQDGYKRVYDIKDLKIA